MLKYVYPSWGNTIPPDSYIGDISANFGRISIKFSAISLLTRVMSISLREKNVEICYLLVH